MSQSWAETKHNYIYLLRGEIGLNLKGLVLLNSLKKENNARGHNRVEIYREIVPETELVVRNQRTLERVGSYPNLS